MSRARGFLHRLRVLVNPAGYAREVEREIRFHLELEAMHRRGEGLDQVAAELAARRHFGNVTHVREEVRRMTIVHWLDRIGQNTRYAWRGLRQSPGFTAAVVLTLALGLGVNAATFSFLDRVFVQPPQGVAAPSEVRRLYYDQKMRSLGNPEYVRIASTVMRYPQIREIARLADSGSVGVFTAFRDSVSFTAGAKVVAARRTLANTAYFRVLGVRPALGRFFDPLEDRIETPANVTVISHDLWRNTFGGDSGVIGRTIRFRARPVTIIGVAAEGFRGIDLDRSDLWMPISHYNTDPPRTPAWYDSFQNNFSVIMRFPTAQAEQRFLDPATRAYRAVRIARYRFDTTGVLLTGPLTAAAGPGPRDQELSIALRLEGVALIVLLIALANVSNLLLVRATRRSREIAIRRALGVSRARLFEQLFIESAVLAGLAGLVSIVLGFWVGGALRALLLPQVAWARGPIDLRTAFLALAATVVVAFLVGLAPALQAWATDAAAALKSGASSANRRSSRMRAALLVTQTALSVMLLAGAGLFVKSLRNVQAIDVGYDIDRTLMATAVAERSVRTDVARVMPALMARVRAIPGVEAVAGAASGPMQGYGATMLYVPGRDSMPSVGGERGASYLDVTPGYLRATGLRLLSGRDFTESDRGGLIVNQAMAQGWWPGESAVGKCVIRGKPDAPCEPVIGVVENANTMRLMESAHKAQYLVSTDSDPHGVLVVRADPARQAAIAAIIADEMKRLVPAAEYIRVRSMLTNLEPELRPWRLGATLFTALGLLAVFVAAIGVYSVVAYAVSQRTNEMGIRIALGAQMADVIRLVLADGLRTVAFGVAAGVVVTLALGKLVSSLLYGTSARDPWVIAAATVLLMLVGVLASMVPAFRASRVDPISALRTD